LTKKLDSLDDEEHSGDDAPKTHLCVRKARGYPQSYLTKNLALA
jgi:hypothetical protein